jgi:hypothetical protein
MLDVDYEALKVDYMTALCYRPFGDAFQNLEQRFLRAREQLFKEPQDFAALDRESKLELLLEATRQ